MKRIAVAFSLILLISIVNGQPKFRIRPHFLGLSFSGSNKVFQMGLFNHNRRIHTFQGTILQIGLINMEKMRTIPPGKTLQIGLINRAWHDCTQKNNTIIQLGV